MKKKTNHSPFRDFSLSLLTPVNLVICLLMAVGASTAGPFGTFETMEAIPRTVYWSVVTTAAFFLGNFARFLSIRVLGSENQRNVDALTGVFAVLFVTPVVWLVTIQIPYVKMEDVPSFPQFVLYVCIGTIGAVAFRRIVIGASGKTLYELQLNHVQGEEKPECAAPRLAERLNDEANTPILRITVRDHLVDVVSERQTETLRMRFADAINEMEPVKGYSTHRSHWVTHDAIQGVVHEPGGKVFLHLRNGDKVPVSRKYRPDLEDAGIV